jgi:hypothetical protein
MEQANNQLMEQQQQHLVVQPDGSPDNNDGIDIHISQDDYNSITATRYTGINHHHQQQQQGQDQQSHLQPTNHQHQSQNYQQQSPLQHQQVLQPMHQVTTSQSQLQPIPSSSTSAFAPIQPVRPTPCYPLISTTTFANNPERAQLRNFSPLTPPLPAALPQPYQQIGSSTIPALFVKIYLLTEEDTSATKSTLTAQKFFPATFQDRHTSNSFYTSLKETYMADLRQTVPYKQLSQIGVRHELRSMTSTYTSNNNNIPHTFNLKNPLTPGEKMMAPDPLIQTNAHYGNFIELNISFHLRLHKPPPEAYTLTLDDRNMMRSFLDQHRSRNQNTRRTNSPIQHRVGYQTQNFRNRDTAAARTAPREYPRGDPRDMARRDQELRRRTPQGAPSLQEQQNLTYHDNGSISFEQDGVTYETTFHGRNYYNLP